MIEGFQELPAQRQSHPAPASGWRVMRSSEGPDAAAESTARHKSAALKKHFSHMLPVCVPHRGVANGCSKVSRDDVTADSFSGVTRGPLLKAFTLIPTSMLNFSPYIMQ